MRLFSREIFWIFVGAVAAAGAMNIAYIKNAGEELVDSASASRTIAAVANFPKQVRYQPVAAVDYERVLMITDLSVVEDPVRTAPGGVWAFDTILRSIAGNQNINTFINTWLGTLKEAGTMNGFLYDQRHQMGQFLESWPKTHSGGYDLTRAPFRLLAIVSRMDLRNDTQAGEGRFVFGFVHGDGNPLPATLIFEYSLPSSSCAETVQWAKAWRGLETVPFGPKYNAALERITKSFTTPVYSGRVNGSAINQVRINETNFAIPWQLREFKLEAQSGLLKMVPAAQTPDTTFVENDDQRLRNVINSGEQNGMIFNVPADMRTPAASIGVNWNISGISPQARNKFAAITCNGCHNPNENGTHFTHVGIRRVGTKSDLSCFLLGNLDPQGKCKDSFRDPFSTTVFSQLGDLARRATDIVQLSNSFCPVLPVRKGASGPSSATVFKPTGMAGRVH